MKIIGKFNQLIDCIQYEPDWWSARLGKPSASCAKMLVTSTGAISKQMADYAIDLANALFAGKPVDQWEGNSATQRGTDLEPEARAAYEFLSGNDVIEIGSFTDDAERYIASPDGCIGDNGLLEIKNLSGKNHSKALMYYLKHKKPPPDYIPQLQMQLLVAERDYCDFFLHHPDLPCLVIRQYRDDKIMVPLISQLEACIDERDSVLQKLQEF